MNEFAPRPEFYLVPDELPGTQGGGEPVVKPSLVEPLPPVSPEEDAAFQELERQGQKLEAEEASRLRREAEERRLNAHDETSISSDFQ